MRPASASIRFHTREEDICCSKAIDWGDDCDPDSGGKINRETLAQQRISRPASAAAALSSSRRPAVKPLLFDASACASACEGEVRDHALDERTRGYKGFATCAQLALCPTPRLDLFAAAPVKAAREEARPATAGALPPPNPPPPYYLHPPPTPPALGPLLKDKWLWQVVVMCWKPDARRGM
jgi:hypothetical protein